MKHIRTEVSGSRKKRVYDKPATPFERLKACVNSDAEQIARLEKHQAKLRPLELKRRLQKISTTPAQKNAAGGDGKKTRGKSATQKQGSFGGRFLSGVSR